MKCNQENSQFRTFSYSAAAAPDFQALSLADARSYKQVRLFCVPLALFFLASALMGAAQTVSPSSLSFGNEEVGFTRASKKVTLTNKGKAAITITSIVTTLSDYAETNDCPLSPATLAPKASCTIDVSFTPTELGTRSGSLTITDGETQNVSLSGTGIVDVSAPSTLAFGNELLEKKSAAKSVTVKNDDPAPLTITSITTNSSDYSITADTCPLSPATLAPDASCKITLAFTPSILGPDNATLTIADNASNSPAVSLTGTGVPVVSVTPASLVFNGQALGTTSSSQMVTLTNNQSTKLKITSITSSLSDFGFTSTCPLSPSTLAVGASCSVSVTFSPAATGTRSGTLIFVDNAGDSPQTISLTGTGLAASLVSIAVTPANPSVAAGTAEQFTATGTYSNNSTQNLTNSVTWASSSATVATVSATGLATTVNGGTTTVSATSGTVVGSTLLTVTGTTPIQSRMPERVCVVENETATSSSCALSASIAPGNGLVVFITSVNGATLTPNALQDSAGNTYSLLAGPVSGGYGSIYVGYSQLTSALNAGNTITVSVPSSDSWGLSIYNIGPVSANAVDAGVTFQNAEAGLPNYNNPATGVPGWWTGLTAATTGSQDICMAAVGVGPGSTGNGPPEPITTFTANNNFTKLDMTQFYAQGDPAYSNGGSVMTMYTQAAAGSKLQSNVTTSDSIPNNAPAVLYCFKEGPGTVAQVPWFTGNYCSAEVSCTISNVSAGDMLVVTSHTFNLLPGTPIVVTDSLGESLTFDQISGSTGLGTWHISPVVNGGNHTITVDDPLDGSLLIDVAEISGQASGNPVEAVGQNSFNVSSQAFADLTTITPNDLLFAWGRSYYGSDEGQGFTGIRVAPTAEFAVAPEPGPQTVQLLPRGTPPWTITGVQAMAIRPAGTAQPTPTGPRFTGNYCMVQGNSCTISNVAAGDILVVSSWWGGVLSTPPQVTDSLGETIVVDRGNDSDGNFTLSTWHIPSVVTAGTHTISINYASIVVVTEYTAQSQISPIDALTYATGTTGGLASASLTTTEGNDLIYAWCGTDNGTQWGDGFAAILSSPASEFLSAAPTPGTETATCSSSPFESSAGWVIQELAIRH